MSSGSHPQAIEDRLQQLESQILQMQRRCRRLLWALAAVAAFAIAAPAIILFRTSFGSELNLRTLVADRIVLRERGELIVQGERDQPRARLGYFADDGWFGLAFFKGDKQVVRLDGGGRPSLTFQADGSQTQLRLGYAGSAGALAPELVDDPLLEIVGHHGKRQVSLSAAGNGDPHLIFWDLDGKQRYVDLTASGGWSSRMTLWHPGTKKGQSRLELEQDALTLYDQEGRRRARLVLDGDPRLLFLDEKGEPMPRK
jgi:hypothetical protein